MAEKPYAILKTGREFEGVGLIKWAGLALNDTGVPFVFPSHADRSVRAQGVFGVAGACTIEASLEMVPTSYDTLNDPHDTPLVLQTSKIRAVLENATNIRPRVTAGDGTTALDVYLLMSK